MPRLTFASPNVGLSEILGASKVLISRQISQGPKVMQFERSFAKLHGLPFGIATNSGTSALHLTLLAAGLTVGDEVLVPAISFGATANAVMLTGAKPVLVDIDASTFLISLEDAEKKVSQRTKGIIPVDLFGMPVSRKASIAFAEKHDLFLLFDSAQSHLAETLDSSDDRFLGHVYSFYGTKNMTTGEGGMLLTANKQIQDDVRCLRNQGMTTQYQYEMVGFNNRLTDLQAAIGLAQLGKLDKHTKIRRRQAAIYDSELSLQGQASNGHQSVFHQYTVKTNGLRLERDEVISTLAGLGIPTRVFYPETLDKVVDSPKTDETPNASSYVKNCLSLPIGPHLKMSQVKYVARTVNSLAGS